MIIWLQLKEINENKSKGKPRPKPKKIKFKTLLRKLSKSRARAKKAPINPGLQGITIAPKKKPYSRAFRTGFFVFIVLALGRNFPMSISKIKKMLIIPNMVKAIGEIIPITFVNEYCKTVVKTKPIRNINKITPNVIKNPNNAYCFLVAFLENWFARYAKKAG